MNEKKINPKGEEKKTTEKLDQIGSTTEDSRNK